MFPEPVMQARLILEPRPPRTARNLLIAALVALLVGASSGFAVYRIAPGSMTGLLGALRPHAAPASQGQTTEAVAHGSVALPAETAALFQQFNMSISSYKAQPVDAISSMRLIIAKIHLNAPIVERGLVDGWMVVAPGITVTHFTFSAYPGAVGNSIMYSHDGTAFRRLDALGVGDTIIVQTPHGALEFRVRELRIIGPQMLSVLDTTQTPVLTLLTCFPIGVDSSRLAVIADLVQP